MSVLKLGLRRRSGRRDWRRFRRQTDALKISDYRRGVGDKPDSGTVIGSTVSEGIGYGMILAVYMDEQGVFDNFWKYEQIHLNGIGLMDWEIGPNGEITENGSECIGDTV